MAEGSSVILTLINSVAPVVLSERAEEFSGTGLSCGASAWNGKGETADPQHTVFLGEASECGGSALLISSARNAA